MISAVLPKSLQRTDSTGQLNVFLLLKRKSNDDLILISREDLPPTLRSVKLVLNQKKQMLKNKIQNDEVNTIANSSTGHSSSSRARVNARCSTTIAKRPNVSPPTPTTTQKSTKSSSSNKKPVEAPANVPNEADDYQEHDFNNSNTVDVISFDSLSTPAAYEKNKSRTTFESTFDTSIAGTNENGNDIYIDKINELSLQLDQQTQIIKERDAELKRLRSISIEIPTDQAVRDYICYFAGKIKQQTTGHRYTGNLTNDAKRLGIGVEKLIEVLKLKSALSSIARELYKRIIPERFLERYYGALEVDPKKIQISLIGCLRNDRGKQKKLKQQVEISANDNNDDDQVEEIKYVDDGDIF
ncbi:unnamed protein product [Rotaria magnacalcarata]|uniref:Uncharacterized protein n=1 Tax=Rotaria magnacalcarata TaxID=392030 RepID=A0A816SLC9_9BILA|nr:unnamed protein product [Rotaria magnacalcarata]